MREPHVPPGWVPVLLLFWGGATEQWAPAGVAAAIVGASSFVRWRWDFSSHHYERLADLSSVAFAGLSVYQFTTHGVVGVYTILATLPWCLLPLCVLQHFGTTGRIPLSALMMSRRRLPTADATSVDIDALLGAGCMLSASVGRLPLPWYGVGVAVALSWLLLANRPRRYSPSGSALALAVTLVLGWSLHVGIIAGQYRLADLLQSLIGELGWVPASPGETYTALGMLGRLKLSDRIVLRVHTSRPLREPLRLTEARYQKFQNGLWRNVRTTLTTIDPQPTGDMWLLDPGPPPPLALTVTAERQRELGALALPPGAARIHGRSLLELRADELGTVVAEARPGFIRYDSEYRPDTLPHTAPQAADLEVPEGYRAMLRDIVHEANASNVAPAVARERVATFFARNFRYSLVQPGYFPGRTPLAAFLRDQRHGHCEYFATATVLLMRVAGVPARYSVGYVADEYSALEQAYVVRARHAHAWAEVFIDGAWQVLDTTPSQWYADEAAQDHAWQGLLDLWSWLRWQTARVQSGELQASPWLASAVPLLLGLLAWRLRGLSRRQGGAPASLAARELKPLYARAARHGFHPAPGDTPRDFLLQHAPLALRPALRQLLTRYYVVRFGDTSLTAKERAALRAAVRRLAGAWK